MEIVACKKCRLIFGCHPEEGDMRTLCKDCTEPVCLGKYADDLDLNYLICPSCLHLAIEVINLKLKGD